MSNALQIDERQGDASDGADSRTSRTSAISPRVVAVGGLDPTGGAGLIRDYVTATRLGAEVRLVPTAFTEQSHDGVSSIEPRPAAALERSLRNAIHIFSGAGENLGRNLVVKVGMLPGEEQVHAVLAGMTGFSGAVVVDPVLYASSGGRLFEASPSRLWPLFRRASLVTPNVAEAEVLATIQIRRVEDAEAAGRRLVNAGMPAVLVKGGHIDGGQSIDVLVTQDQDAIWFAGPRLPVGNVRGTGCALATAIAVGLARGSSLQDTIRQAKAWLQEALGSAVASVGTERHFIP